MGAQFKNWIGDKGDLEGVPTQSVAQEAWNSSLRELMILVEENVKHGEIPTNLKGYFKLKELVNHILSNERL